MLVLIAALTVAAFNMKRVGKSEGTADYYSVDSAAALPVAISATGDSAAVEVTDSLTAMLDSMKVKFDREHGIKVDEGRGAQQWNDSIAAVEDSIRKTKKKSALEAPVVYEAKDSMTVFMDTKNAFLYGDANVKYLNIELTSEQMTMNMDSSIVHAVYGLDSIGDKFGLPIFKEGSEEYKSEKMSYNFDTKKGFIHNVYTAQQDGFLRAEASKKGADNEIYMRRGTYTTCDEEHPHFYIAMSRGKVRPGKSVFSGLHGAV